MSQITSIATSGGGGSITITGDTGGALTGSSFTFTGGTTGLSFGGMGTTETLTFAGITANGGTVSLATDATNSTVNIGTGAGIKLVAVGSANSSSSLTLNSGSGGVVTTGISGVTTSSPAFVTVDTVSGQLGSQSLSATSALALIQTQSVSGATAINFTSGITTTFNNYLLICDSVTTSTTGLVFIQLSTNGGSSYITSGYDTTSTGAGILIYNIASAVEPYSCHFNINNMTSGSGYIIGMGQQVTYNLPGTSVSTTQIKGAYGTASTVVNAIRIFIDGTKTITGSFSLYGYTK
jgi:hypothetical protein